MTQPQVKVLLDVVRSNDGILEERRNAIETLALLIEKNSVGADTGRTYQEFLPQALLEIRVTESEKSELIEILCRQIELEPTGQGLLKELIWTIGKADIGPSMNALQCIIRCALERPLEEAELRQAILSLEDLTYSIKDTQLAPLLPTLKHLRSKIIASGNETNKKAIDSYFAKLTKRNLPGV